MHIILGDYALMKPNERLIAARKDAGYETAQDAANALGLKYPTYAAHENGTRDFVKNAGLYARRFNTTIDWLLTGKPVRNQSAETTVAPTPEGTSSTGRIPKVRVVGTVKASFWQDVTDLHEPDEMYVPGSDTFPVEMQYAFVVDGPSVNKTARDGDVLICVDLIKSQAVIEDNDLVIVERTRYAGAMLERTAKRVRKSIAGFELWPDSDDPEFQEPLPISSHGTNDEEVRVSAKVVWVLRKP